MTALALTAPPVPASSAALTALRDALAQPPSLSRDQHLSQVLRDLQPAAGRSLALGGGPLSTLLRLRPELSSPTADERLSCRRRSIATELLWEYHRALVNAPHTILALAAGAPNPVHGQERQPLAMTVLRRLTIEGCQADELTVRSLTYAVSAALRDALHA